VNSEIAEIDVALGVYYIDGVDATGPMRMSGEPAQRRMWVCWMQAP
jgi:hypothetical protein